MKTHLISEYPPPFAKIVEISHDGKTWARARRDVSMIDNKPGEMWTLWGTKVQGEWIYWREV